MAMTRGLLPVLLREGVQRPFSGRVLTLGRQDILFSLEVLKCLAGECEFRLGDMSCPQLSLKEDFAAKGYLLDEFFWKSLGFSAVDCLDCVADESPTVIFDLNNVCVPEWLQGRFDVIVDGGVMEHIFHVPHVLQNLYHMVCPGGRIIHLSPTSNFVDHGFYMFSPTLFWDFYKANGFEMNTFQFVRGFPRMEGDCEFLDYVPGMLDGTSFGGLDGGMYGTVCIVTKTSSSTSNRIPRQGLYAEDRLGRRKSACTKVSTHLSTSL